MLLNKRKGLLGFVLVSQLWFAHVSAMDVGFSNDYVPVEYEKNKLGQIVNIFSCIYAGTGLFFTYNLYRNIKNKEKLSYSFKNVCAKDITFIISSLSAFLISRFVLYKYGSVKLLREEHLDRVKGQKRDLEKKIDKLKKIIEKEQKENNSLGEKLSNQV